MQSLVQDARSAPAPTALSGLAIKGNDILSLGVKPGPQIGQILNTLMESVIEHPEKNTREQLLADAQELIGAPAASTFT
jgi:tRNA nucleotidyltransferase (CCA-adding enzyme)